MEAWIQGRVLRPAVNSLGKPSPFGAFKLYHRVQLDLMRDREVLGIDQPHGLPFHLEPELFVTIHDFDMSGPQPRLAPSEIMELPNIRFTKRALDSASQEFVSDSPDNLTRKLVE